MKSWFTFTFRVMPPAGDYFEARVVAATLAAGEAAVKTRYPASSVAWRHTSMSRQAIRWCAGPSGAVVQAAEIVS